MRSVVLMAVLLFAHNASALVASCEIQDEKVMMVVESRGDKLTRELEFSGKENIGNRILSNMICGLSANAVNHLRGKGYSFLECNIRTNPGTRESQLTVEKPDAGGWIWSSGVANVTPVTLNDKAISYYSLCEQVADFTNTF